MTIRETISSQWDALSEHAQTWAVRTARVDLNQWELAEAGHWYTTVTAPSREEALKQARDSVDRGNYSDCEGTTLYIDVRVRNVITGENDSDTVTLQPEEPNCEDGQEHDWRSPYSVLGGLKENPGVWGHGGGVIIKTVCANCGRYRITDTWAQRPDTGEQGLDSTSYEDADEVSLAWIERRKESA